MSITNCSKSEQRIISFLYSFRYLQIKQIQKLFDHKSPNRIKIWLKHLLTNHFIYAITNKKDRTKPYIYCLDQKASKIVSEVIKKEDLDKSFTNRIYKEKSYSRKFINRNLFIVDCYLYFLKHKEKDSTINFFTRQDLYGYSYFPKPLPDSYIDEEVKTGHNRYFLEVFSYNVPIKYHFQRIEYYFDYFDDGQWKENTNGAPFPSLLIVCANNQLKRKIFFHAKSLLERSYDEISVFLATADKITRNDENVWDEVRVD